MTLISSETIPRRCGVQSGGLSGAGRTGDEEDAVRLADDVLELLEHLALEAEVRERQLNRPPVEDTHDDAFAEDHRDDADTEVYLSIADLDLEAAVLGDAAFGDVEIGENLDAADDGGLKLTDLGRNIGIAKDAIDPVANHKVVFIGLDVNVARSLVDRLEQDFIYKLDDAGILGHLRKVSGRFTNVADDFDIVLVDQFADGITTDTEVFLQNLVDLAFLRENRLYLQTGDHAKFVECVDLEGISGGDAYRTVLAIERDELGPVDQLRGHHLDRVDIDHQSGIGQIDDVEMIQPAQGLEHIGLAAITETDEHLVEAIAGATLLVGDIQLILCDDSVFDQDVSKIHGDPSFR